MSTALPKNYRVGQVVSGARGASISVGCIQYDEHGPWYVICTLEYSKPLAGPITSLKEAQAEAVRQTEIMRAGFREA